VRILHVLPSLSSETGGPAQSVPRLCKAIGKAGNEVVLYSTFWPKYDPSLSPEGSEKAGDGFTIKIFPIKPSRVTGNLPHSPALLKSLRNHCMEFDMVVNHSLWNPIASSAMRILRHNLAIYAVMAHGMLDPVVLRRNRWKKIPWAFLWERRNVENAALIVLNTPAEERKARQSGWSLRRTFIFPHIVELQDWKVLPPRSQFEMQFPQVRGSEVILFAGRINWVKNLDKLIEALAIVRQTRPSAVLVCVGPDNNGYRVELERRAQALGIHQHILFTGLLDGEDLKAAYARGDVFALVSQKENFGLAAADALASGLPTVVSEGVDSCQDWVSEGPVRRVSPTPEAIATALIDLLERSASLGLPDPEAQKLAEREWGESRILPLIATCQSLLPEKNLESIKGK